MLLLWFLMAPVWGQQCALFYLSRDAQSVKSFREHARHIDLLVPAWYSTDAQGGLRGAAEGEVLQLAASARIPVMPIVVNPGFSGDTFHRLASRAEARRRLIQALVHECHKQGYAGVQLDFEGIAASDRDWLSLLVEQAAAAFHAAGLKLSLAAIPRSADGPGSTPFARWAFDHLQGAYDLARLARSLDFISWMTYDQHMRATTPGPVAGYPWVVEQLNYALRFVPRHKLSLGIPLYGRHWHAGVRGAAASMQMATVSARQAEALAKSHGVAPQWDPLERAPWFFFYREGVREYVFYSDARAFKERLELVRQHGLHGFSSWVLGMEDPGIWDVLKAMR